MFWWLFKYYKNFGRGKNNQSLYLANENWMSVLLKSFNESIAEVPSSIRRF